MKIPANQIEAFLKKPNSNVNAVLIYGPDIGQVTQNKQKIINNILPDKDDPFCFIEFDYDKIKNNINLFSDEIYALGFTDDQRAVVVNNVKPSLAKELIEILSKYDGNCFVIFTAGELPPASSARKLFEKEKHLAALPCYKDEKFNIKIIIENTLKTNGFSFDYNVANILANRFFGDRMIIMSEIEKLITYMGENKKITTQDVEALIEDNKEIGTEQMINDIASGNYANIETGFNKMINEGVQPVTLIRAILKYFLKLHMVKTQILFNGDEQQALALIKPPLFFKQVPIFKKHLSIWPLNAIEQAIEALNNLEVSCKTTGNPVNLLTGRFLTIFPAAIKKRI